jgi:lipopolysaccharide/colanic/teichoic acid biosynthesis glycosyltransferase
MHALRRDSTFVAMNSSPDSILAVNAPALSARPLPTWKRALDVIIILSTLPLVAPIAFVISAIIKLTSRGPVFFKQARVGHLGKQFLCFKFRTMKVDADTVGHQAHFHQLMGSNKPMVKLDARGDTRLIPGGWLIRALGLDELPQLLNILRGEMSLVGPRPCIPYECKKYLPWQMERFSAVPGLTGLWQVSGKNKTTFEEMIRLDIRYAQSKTFWMDVKIILMTPTAIVKQVIDTKLSRATTQTTEVLHPTEQPRVANREYFEKTLTS